MSYRPSGAAEEAKGLSLVGHDEERLSEESAWRSSDWALTLSPSAYNRKTGLALFCPITSQIKGYPFEVIVAGKKISGAVLVDQVKSLDWRAREASYVERVSKAALSEALAKIAPLLR